MTPKRRNRVADSLFSWFSEHHGPGARKLEQIGAGSEYKSKEREASPEVAAPPLAGSARIGSIRVIRSPNQTTGALASIMPSVVPATTQNQAWYWAASMTVAICVLSPISARKKASTVVPKMPSRGALPSSSPSSSWSGINIQAAMARKETPRTQRSTSGPSKVVTQVPSAPASAWLAKVATRMPATMGQGLRKRAARTSESSWVLSPISARATIPVETRKASMDFGGRADCCTKPVTAPHLRPDPMKGTWRLCSQRSRQVRKPLAPCPPSA